MISHEKRLEKAKTRQDYALNLFENAINSLNMAAEEHGSLGRDLQVEINRLTALQIEADAQRFKAFKSAQKIREIFE